MTAQELTGFQSDAFRNRFFGIGTPATLRTALSRAPEVKAVREAMRECRLDELTVARFVSQLLDSFQRGSLFEHDLTLAALAVALEATFSPQVDQFLDSLARLHIAEIPTASRVARLSLKSRGAEPSLTFKLYALDCSRLAEPMKVLDPMDRPCLSPATRRIPRASRTHPAPEVFHAEA